MIQFNLLPDVKLQYIRATRAKRSVVTISTIVTIAAVTITVLLVLVVLGLQKKHLSDLNKDISSQSAKLESVTDLNKILTVQNQLNSLSSIHAQKPAATRLVNYIQQITPANASISDITINFDDQSVNLNGSADSIETINRFTDTLKFTDYKLDGNTTRAFSDVVLGGFNKGTTETTYLLNFKFDPVIFDSTKAVTLDVPKSFITTRSLTEKPGQDIIKPQSKQ
jgi:Tfp pilus assembly protein PilN